MGWILVPCVGWGTGFQRCYILLLADQGWDCGDGSCLVPHPSALAPGLKFSFLHGQLVQGLRVISKASDDMTLWLTSLPLSSFQQWGNRYKCFSWCICKTNQDGPGIRTLVPKFLLLAELQKGAARTLAHVPVFSCFLNTLFPKGFEERPACGGAWDSGGALTWPVGPCALWCQLYTITGISFYAIYYVNNVLWLLMYCS